MLLLSAHGSTLIMSNFSFWAASIIPQGHWLWGYSDFKIMWVARWVLRSLYIFPQREFCNQSYNLNGH
jgi:hypothetical protein